MNFKRSKLSLAVVGALALVGCGGDDGGSDPVVDAGGPAAPTLATAKYMVFAVDGEGNVNLFADDGGSEIAHVTTQTPKNTAGGLLTLGEIHFNSDKSRAYVIVQDGFVDANGASTGGGIVEIDTSNGNIVSQLNLVSTKTPYPARLIHSYVSPDGKYLWINNDGPRNSDATPDIDESAPNDSVFRLNIDPSDTTDADGPDSFVDDMYLDYVEIEVGNGHKKGAHASGKTNAGADVRPLFVTHDLTSRTVSVIDNDLTSPTFLQVVKTVDLGGPNIPHGMAFSPYNGAVYTGVVSGVPGEIGLSVIDATSPDLTASQITAGMDQSANQIPTAGYVKTFHSHHPEIDGKWVFTAGYKGSTPAGSAGNGYFSVIDTSTGAGTVADVVNIGDIATSSFVTTEMHHDGEEHTLVFLGSTSNSPTMNTHMAIVHIDNATGMHFPQGDKNAEHIEIGPGQSHRNGKAADDGEHVFMPNGGDCADDTRPENGPDCKTIAVYDTRTGGVMKISTTGVKPGSIAVLKLRDIEAASSPIPAPEGTVPHDHGAVSDAPATDGAPTTDGHAGH